MRWSNRCSMMKRGSEKVNDNVERAFAATLSPPVYYAVSEGNDVFVTDCVTENSSEGIQHPDESVE